MSPFMINLVTLSSKPPATVVAHEGFFASVCPEVMAKTCALCETTVTALAGALVEGLELLLC